MKHKQHFYLLIEMNKLMIDENILFACSFPIENEDKKREAGIVPEEFSVGSNANWYHDWRSINASA